MHGGVKMLKVKKEVINRPHPSILLSNDSRKDIPSLKSREGEHEHRECGRGKIPKFKCCLIRHNVINSPCY